MELSIGRDQARSSGEWQGGKDTRDEFVCAVSEGHIPGLIVEQCGEGPAVPLRLRLGDAPFLIYMLGGVEPGPLLTLEGDIGPRLVGVTREE